MKNSGYIFFFLFFKSLFGYCQTDNPEIDSLIQKAIAVSSKSQDSAVYFTKKSFEVAKKEKDTFLIASTGYYYSYYLITIDSTTYAQSILQFNLDNQNKLPNVLNGNTYYNLAAIYDLEEKFDVALENYFKSIDFYKAANNKKGLAKSYLQIGVIYEKLNKLKLADYFFDASLEVTGNKNKKHRVDSTRRGMTPSEKTASSLKMLSELDSDNRKLKSIVCYNIGQSLMSEKRFSEAITYFITSLKTKKNINFLANIDKTYFLLGKCYYNINDSENAIINLKKAKKVNQKAHKEAEIESFLSKCYEQKGDYKTALFHSVNYKTISDSIAKLQQNERIAEITAKFENQKQANKIIRLEQENQKNELEISKQENLRWRWFLVALIATLLSVWLGKRFIASQKRVKEIEHEKEEISRKVEQIALILNNKSKIYLDLLKFIKSDGNYLEFVTEDKTIIDRNKLKDVLEELPPNFVRVHRSYVINKNFIASQNSTTLFLRPNIEIPLSRTFKSNLS